MGDYIENKYGILFKISFLILLFLFSIIGILQLHKDSLDEIVQLLSYGLLPFILMLSAAVLGYIEKSLIGFKKGRWKRRERAVSFEEYVQIFQEHKKEFSKIYDDWDDCSGFCFSMTIPLLLFITFGVIPEGFNAYFPDFTFLILYIFLGYAFLGYLSYKIGYHSKKYKKKKLFKAPPEEEFEYVKSISKISDLRIKARIKTKEMDELAALYKTDWYFYIDGLPETVYIKLKMEKTDWSCGLLVGTILGGPFVDERTEQLPLEEFCPAIMQYSNSEKGTTIVCKYDIDSDKCIWDFVGNPDIEKLAKFLVIKLRELYSELNLVK
ncbi:MAG: hypothetical protein ACTSV2_15975 [Candidatus Thorarchaeota archaeon]